MAAIDLKGILEDVGDDHSELGDLALLPDSPQFKKEMIVVLIELCRYLIDNSKEQND